MSTERHRRRLNSILFNLETTMRSDYTGGHIKAPVLTKYQEKPTCLMKRPPPLKGTHTLTTWRHSVPIDLFVPLKPIVRTKPFEARKPYVHDSDEEREQAIKTRPRLIMTPSIGIDDIKDPGTRKIVVDDVYQTSTDKCSREALANVDLKTVRAPIGDRPAQSNPIVLEKLQPPMVPPEWRMSSASWDMQQLRTYCRPTEQFWLARTPQCDVCHQSAVVQSHRMGKPLK